MRCVLHIDIAVVIDLQVRLVRNDKNSFELNCMLKYLFLYLFFNKKKYILHVSGLCPEGILS